MEKTVNKIEKIMKGRIITLYPPDKGNCPWCFTNLESFDIYNRKCVKCNKEITDFDYLEAVANVLNFTLEVETVKISKELLHELKRIFLKEKEKELDKEYVIKILADNVLINYPDFTEQYIRDIIEWHIEIDILYSVKDSVKEKIGFPKRSDLL